MRWFVFLICFLSRTDAQVLGDKKLLLSRADESLVLFPKKSQDIAQYIQVNFPDRLSQIQAASVLATSHFYQNNITSVIDMISNDPYQQDNISYSSIFYYLGIRENSLYKDKDVIRFLILLDYLEKSKNTEASAVFNELLARTDNDHKFLFRDFWLTVLDHLSSSQVRFLSKGINRLMTYYHLDPEFLLKATLFSHFNKDLYQFYDLSSTLRDSIENSSNIRLLQRYYDTRMTLQFYVGEKQDYISSRQKRDTISKELRDEAVKSRSLWFSIKEKQNRDKTAKKLKDSRLLLLSVCSVLFLLLLLAILYLRALKVQQKYFELFQKKIRELSEKKQQNTAIPEKTENALLAKLDLFENSTDYLDTDISLNSLAKKLDTNIKYLSEAINTHKQKNFNVYINELRINYILIKLNEQSRYRNYKIKYLAEEAGFSSHSLFASVFKSITGMSPMVYIKFLKESKGDGEE